MTDVKELPADVAGLVERLNVIGRGDGTAAKRFNVELEAATAILSLSARLKEVEEERDEERAARFALTRANNEKLFKLEATEAALAELREKTKTVVNELYELCLHGDFSNGVTDSTGSIDEGDVRAGEYMDRARAFLASLEKDTSHE